MKKRLFSFLNMRLFNQLMVNSFIVHVTLLGLRKALIYLIQKHILYKKQLESFWQASEVDFSNDFKDYMTLSTEEKEFVKMILAFFAASDGIVNFIGFRLNFKWVSIQYYIALQFDAC
mgnify:CR=1 FL=1